MIGQSELIVMLTHNDQTVPNAHDIFLQCRESKARFWGMKEKPLSFNEMKKLYQLMKACDKTTFLEVVAYSEEEGFEGAQMAVDCGADVLMGTLFSDKINGYCKAHGLKYMPFVGNVSGRPSVLTGSVQEIIAEAKYYLNKGVYGIDLLGYRYSGDAVALNKALVDALDAPVCLAGSIDSIQRLDEVKDAAPWAFTIGSAFFNQRFPGDICAQIDFVCDYMKGESKC